jgi:hypothetical protein
MSLAFRINTPMSPTTLRYLQYSLAALLFLCLLDMPYGFYQFVRLAATVVFVVLGVRALGKNYHGMMITWFALAILFQPFYKIALGREVWNIVDVAVGVFLIIQGSRKGR